MTSEIKSTTIVDYINDVADITSTLLNGEPSTDTRQSNSNEGSHQLLSIPTIKIAPSDSGIKWTNVTEREIATSNVLDYTDFLATRINSILSYEEWCDASGRTLPYDILIE